MGREEMVIPGETVWAAVWERSVRGSDGWKFDDGVDGVVQGGVEGWKGQGLMMGGARCWVGCRRSAAMGWSREDGDIPALKSRAGRRSSGPTFRISVRETP